MSAARNALDWCRDKGVWLELDGNNIAIIHANRLTTKQIDRLRARKSEIVEELRFIKQREEKGVAEQAARFNDNSPMPDWWKQPVQGWGDGVITIQNMVTGKVTIVDLNKREMA